MRQSAAFPATANGDSGAVLPQLPSLVLTGVYMLVVIATLRTCGIMRTLRLVNWITRGICPTPGGSFALAESVAQRVALVAALYPGRARCLEQSLTSYWLLRHLNMDAVLRLGVQPVGFAAHAWVEYEGQAVMESEVVRTVVPFPELRV